MNRRETMPSPIKLQKMVEEIEKNFALNPHVRDAFLRVDRESFVPGGFQHLAYQLDALPMSARQWISSPLTVAKMTQHLELKNVDTILEVGCGSGYQAAILSQICRRVFTIERIDTLIKEARGRFSELEINNIFTRFDDGQRGWKAHAPYERILFSATAKEIPQILFDQLAEGGILVAPVQEGPMEIITRFYKRKGRISSEAIEPCRFVPVLSGTEKS